MRLSQASTKLLLIIFAFAAFPYSMAYGSNNPTPFLNAPLVPGTAAPGGSAFTLTVNGAGFVGTSVVEWNKTALVTTYVSATQLTAAVPAADIVSAGTAMVTVVNPTPGGGTSNSVPFEITTSADSILFLQADYATGQSPLAIVTGDFNGDGKPDVVVSNLGSNNISVLLGTGDGKFQPHVDYNTGTGPADMAVADFNGDGKLDLAVLNTGCPTDGGNCGDASISIFAGNGDGTFQTPLTITPAGFIPDGLAAGDLNGDGKVDLAVSAVGASGGFAAIYLGNGDGTFTAGAQYLTGRVSISSTPPIVIGDFNGDGYLDLALAQAHVALSISNVDVLLGNGDGTFQDAVSYAAAPGASIVASGDFNGDGILDLAALSTSTGQNRVSVLLGVGDGTFLAFSEYVTGNNPSSLTLADLNGDGKLDLAIAARLDNSATYLLGNGNGTFQDQLATPAGSGPVGNAAADFNGDGRMDLAVVNYTDSTVSSVLQVPLGPQPTAALSTFSLSFTSQAVGSTSTAQIVTLSNEGPAPLLVSSIVATGDFSQTNGCGSSVAANSACTINVTFTPTAAGTRNGTLTIIDNSDGLAGIVQVVSLQGAGTTPAVSLSAALTFTAQVVGSTSSAQTITLTNTGAANLIFSAAPAVSGPFAIAAAGTTCSTAGPVIPAGTCTVSVTFTPTEAGQATGSVSFTDNAANSPQGVPLMGTGKDFTFAAASGGSTSATITAGQTATYQLSVGGQDGLTGSVAFACSGAPAEATCTAAPNPATLGSSPTDVTITVSTTAASMLTPLRPSLPPPPHGPLGATKMLLLVLAIMAALTWNLRKAYRLGIKALRPGMLLLMACFVLSLAMAGCGSGGGGGGGGTHHDAGTPTGAYTLTVTGTTGSGSSAVSHNVQLTLHVN